MLTLKWLIGLICFFYPTSVEGAQLAAATASDSDAVHADQMTCARGQGLTDQHAG